MNFKFSRLFLAIIFAAIVSVLMSSLANAFESWGLNEIDALKAWKLSAKNQTPPSPGASNNRTVTVAVIDTGIDVNHPDLKDRLWTNPGESGTDVTGHNKANNGIDDDANGFIDDVHGWNFVDNNNDIADHHGHGTHIAGIIAGSGRVRVTGVAPQARIMVLKYYDPDSQTSPLSSTIKAIRYATAMGAQVINYSGGGLAFSPNEHDAIASAAEKGILLVAAAGNEHTDSDFAPFFPADYQLDNIISVTAINPGHRILKTSNWGERSVDIAAPGENILSTLPGGQYGFMTGTSQATAFVTGAVVLMISAAPTAQATESINWRALKKGLLASGVPQNSLSGKTKTHSALNTYRALAMRGRGLTASDIAADNSDLVDPSLFILSETNQKSDHGH
jgi:subtilisin family serine protease